MWVSCAAGPSLVLSSASHSVGALARCWSCELFQIQCSLLSPPLTWIGVELREVARSGPWEVCTQGLDGEMAAVGPLWELLRACVSPSGGAGW